MKICVLQTRITQPHRWITKLRSAKGLIRPDDRTYRRSRFLNKLSTYKQLREFEPQTLWYFRQPVRGYLEWEVPSIDVIWFWNNSNLPTPAKCLVIWSTERTDEIRGLYCRGTHAGVCVCSMLKPTNDRPANISAFHFCETRQSGRQLGHWRKSLVGTLDELEEKANAIMDEYVATPGWRIRGGSGIYRYVSFWRGW